VVDRLTAGYGENIIIEDVSLEVFPGEILVILGESGCGKSTLMKQMIGIYQPYSGKVLINGIDINTEDETEQGKLRRQIGAAFQAGALFGSMTLGENVALPLQEYTGLPEAEINRIVKMKLGWSTWEVTRITCPRSFREACRSGRGWPGPWLWIPWCFSSMSLRPDWTPSLLRN
jgi:ABC-type transporter Mla maintaining outer membrane lipid asymmetry ATPase subunit MlaF